ncbi:MAG: hypothetical protein Q9208_007262 [Pyrenodesmia sp. 3 TL-2023]
MIVALGWLLGVHNRHALLMFKKDMQRLFGDDFASDAHRRYEEHNEWIRSLVPKERLLELRLGEDGWDPLCKFLAVDKPETEYPRGNATSSLNKKFDAIFWYTFRLVAQKLWPYLIFGAAALCTAGWVGSKAARWKTFRDPLVPWYWRELRNGD